MALLSELMFLLTKGFPSKLHKPSENVTTCMETIILKILTNTFNIQRDIDICSK